MANFEMDYYANKYNYNPQIATDAGMSESEQLMRLRRTHQLELERQLLDEELKQKQADRDNQQQQSTQLRPQQPKVLDQSFNSPDSTITGNYGPPAPTFNSIDSINTGNYGPPDPSGGSGFWSSFFGGGQTPTAEGGTALGGSSSGTTASAPFSATALVAAALLGQHILSNNTDTEIEGVKTSDMWDSHFFTNPQSAFLADKLNTGPTSGEKLDASLANKDYKTSLKRAPAGIMSRLNPTPEMAGLLAEKYIGTTARAAVDPVGTLLRKIGDM